MWHWRSGPERILSYLHLFELEKLFKYCFRTQAVMSSKAPFRYIPLQPLSQVKVNLAHITLYYFIIVYNSCIVISLLVFISHSILNTFVWFVVPSTSHKVCFYWISISKNDLAEIEIRCFFFIREGAILRFGIYFLSRNERCHK